ncbi:MAG: hypothetical protein L3J56_05305 [Bacteroidales bacterium]|nr:hypothetical protein [Bacteroidales bacterium]
MNVSVDISYYPLKEEFKQPVLNFIHRLQNYENLEIIRNGISTQVFGKYDEVMQILTKEIKQSFELPHSIFVLKIINTDLS